MRYRRQLRGLIVSAFLLGVAIPAIGQELKAIGPTRSPGPARTEASKKIVSRLRALIADFQALGITRENAASRDAAGRFSSETLKVDTTGRVQVYVSVTDTTEQTLGTLRQHGFDIEIVNQEFAIVQGWIPVETFPGTGDPWDIYLLALVFSPVPSTIFSLNFATGGFGPADVIQPARPTAPITSSTQSFTFTAPQPAEIGFLCIFADPGLTRINRHSFIPVSFTGTPYIARLDLE